MKHSLRGTTGNSGDLGETGLVAAALIESGELDYAERILKNLAESHPDFSAAYTGLATIAMKNQDWTKVCVGWRYCIEHFDGSAEPGWLFSYANSAIEIDDLVTAEHALDELTEKHPTFIQIYIGYARLRRYQED